MIRLDREADWRSRCWCHVGRAAIASWREAQSDGAMNLAALHEWLGR